MVQVWEIQHQTMIVLVTLVSRDESSGFQRSPTKLTMDGRAGYGKVGCKRKIGVVDLRRGGMGCSHQVRR